MHGCRRQRAFTMEQGWHEECAFAGVGVDDVEIVTVPVNNFCLPGQVCYAGADFLALAEARERAHIDFL